MSQIDELRHILVGDSADELSALKERIESIDARTRDVAEVLPSAIDTSIKQNERLVDSFKVPVSQSLKQAIRTEPKEYAEILYPVMAPSIRRAISQAISSLLVTINQATESATSVKGLGMRFQSFRTGVPYAELALRRSLLYRVQHVYLIDRETGLMIAECEEEGSGKLDSDAVSAMLSAIQSFVQDSFSQNEEDRLTDFKVGEHTVWVAHGPRAMLACVIYGDAPESLKLQLYDSLDVIRSDYGSEIETFDGDVSNMPDIQNHLQPLLQLRLKDDEGGVKKQSKGAIANKLLILGLILLAGYFAYQWFDKMAKLDTANHYLRQTPGLVVTSSVWVDDQIVIEGLQDPDAVLPYKELAAHHVKKDQINLQTIPFRSLEPAMEEMRFKEELDIPQQLTLANKDGKVFLMGEAPIAWLLKNDARLRQLATDKRLDISGLLASEESVNSYIISRFGSVNSAIAQKLIKLFVGKPWGEVSVGAITPGF